MNEMKIIETSSIKKWYAIIDNFIAKGYIHVTTLLGVRKLCTGGPDSVIDVKGEIVLVKVDYNDGPERNVNIAVLAKPGSEVTVRSIVEYCGPNGYAKNKLIRYTVMENGKIAKEVLEEKFI